MHVRLWFIRTLMSNFPSKLFITPFSGADNYPFQEFLASCNPNQQQAHTLESYLIKPIQRILKYPLLLQQLKSLAPNPSEEQNHLTDALSGMENVAEHINEMQRIHEEYGAIFDHLYRQYQRSNRYELFLI